MTDLAGYAAGILLHILTDWAEWKNGDKTKPWLAYWPLSAGAVVAAALGALVLFALWQAGWLPWAITQTLTAFGMMPDKMPPAPTGPFGAALAGYAAQSISGKVWGRIEGKKD